MAKLKLRIPTLDTVPKEQQAFYRAMDGGGFILDHEPDPDGYGIDNLPALRGKLDATTRDHDRLNQRLQGFKKADGSLYTVEELQALATANTELTRSVEMLKDKSKTSEQVIQDAVTRGKQPLESELTKLKGQIDRYKTSAHKAEKARVVAKALDVLKPQDRWRKYIGAEIERRLEIRENDDGSLSHVILDDNGKPRFSSLQGRDGPMDIEEYAKGPDLRTPFADLLQGDGRKGADITNNVQPNPSDSRRVGADVQLPPNYSQAQFEQAFKAAKENGGQVLFPEAQASNT
jgi:hypothetical protein